MAIPISLNLETVSLLLLEDKHNVMFGSVVWCELYMHYECIFYVFV